MTKIIRLNNETCKLLEEYRQQIREEIVDLQMYTFVVKNDNIILQSALKAAIDLGLFGNPKSK